MPGLSVLLPLSTHFTLKELLRSTTAERDEALKREQENPPPEVVSNLQYLAETALEPIRVTLESSLQITSGYRCALVNKLVGGSATSQHCLGEAADCEVPPGFLTDVANPGVRTRIRTDVERRTGRPLRADIDHNFYLFAHVCLRLNDLDIDQVIHEFGDDFGRPAWVHLSASRRQSRRQVLFIGSYTGGVYLSSSVDEALARCCS